MSWFCQITSAIDRLGKDGNISWRDRRHEDTSVSTRVRQRLHYLNGASLCEWVYFCATLCPDSGYFDLPIWSVTTHRLAFFWNAWKISERKRSYTVDECDFVAKHFLVAIENTTPEFNQLFLLKAGNAETLRVVPGIFHKLMNITISGEEPLYMQPVSFQDDQRICSDIYHGCSSYRNRWQLHVQIFSRPCKNPDGCGGRCWWVDFVQLSRQSSFVCKYSLTSLEETAVVWCIVASSFTRGSTQHQLEWDE